ncbi:MAG: hypothetical protein ABEI99_12855, partial [Halobaculum sp.]
GETNALLALLLIAVAIQSLVVYLSKRDTDDGFSSLRDDVSEVRDEVTTGFEDVEASIESMDRTDATPDGGWSNESPGDRRLQTVDFDLEGTSGAGALSGLLAGSAFGTPFGPAGVIVGGIVGGVFGNAVEYHNRKTGKQERLKTAVERYIESNTSPRVRLTEFRGASEKHDDDGDYWLFTFEDQDGNTRQARLDVEEETLSLVS